MRVALFKPVAILLSLRYLLTKDRTLLFVTKTSIVGLVLSIAVLLVVQGVISGFQRDLNQRMLALAPHVTFAKENGLPADLGMRVQEQIPQVESHTHVVYTTGLASNSSEVHTIQLIGIDPAEYQDFVSASPLSHEISWDVLQPGDFNLILGKNLAQKLNVRIGDTVLVTLALGDVSPIGFFPRQKKFRVAGLASTYSSFDSRVSYLNREDATRLLKLKTQSNAVFFHLEDPQSVSEFVYPMYFAANEPDLLGSQWQHLFGRLYDFLVRFKQLLFLMLALLLVVATFNLVSCMVMMVHSRRDDIAVLRTIGGKTLLVLSSFMGTGVIISIIGLLFATVLAYLLGLSLPTLYSWLSQLAGVSLTTSFDLHRLTVVFESDDLLRVIALTVFFVAIGSIYPAWRASQLPPAEILRDE